MTRKSSPPASGPLPPNAIGKRVGRSGEGTASLLAQLSDEQRVNDAVRAERPMDDPDENARRLVFRHDFQA